jgi:hypothetical protein
MSALENCKSAKWWISPYERSQQIKKMVRFFCWKFSGHCASYVIMYKAVSLCLASY